MTKHLLGLWTCALPLLLFIGLFSSAQDRERPVLAPWEERSPALGEVIPDFDVFDENLKPVKLSHLYEGKLLYFQWGGCT